VTSARRPRSEAIDRLRRFERRKPLRARFWGLGSLLFRWSPRSAAGWRRWILRRFGATIGEAVFIDPTVHISHPWNLAVGDRSTIAHNAILDSIGAIRIGAGVVISQYANLCAGDYDYRAKDMDILPAPIEIGDDVWIAADAFVGPNTRLGAGGVLAARSSAFGVLPPEQICIGEPATARHPRRRA